MAGKLYRSSEAQLKNLRLGSKSRLKNEEPRTAGVSAKITPSSRAQLRIITKSMNLSIADLLEGIASGTLEIVRKTY